MRVSDAAAQFDTVVIGAGIVGLSVAYELLALGLRVAVIDRLEPMEGCSAGNAGYLADSNIFPPASKSTLYSVPSMLIDRDGPLRIAPRYLPSLLPWGVQLFRSMSSQREADIRRSLAALTTRAIDAYGPMLKAVGATSMIDRSGGLVACMRSDTLNHQAKMLPVFKRHGIEAVRLNGDQVRELEPALVRDICGGIFFPNAARCVNPQRLGLVIAQYLRANGVKCIQDEVRSFEKAAGRRNKSGNAWSIIGESASYRARRIVVCAGYASTRLMGTLGVKALLASERGYHLMLPESGVSLQRPVVFAEPYFAATPMEHGVRLAGTAEFAHPDKPLSSRRADMLLKLARSYIPQVCGDGASRWMGVRPTTPDGVPYLGKLSGVDGLYYSFGHGHVGLTTAAISAQMLVSSMTGRSNPEEDLRPYSLARFG